MRLRLRCTFNEEQEGSRCFLLDRDEYRPKSEMMLAKRRPSSSRKEARLTTDNECHRSAVARTDTYHLRGDLSATHFTVWS